MTETLDHDVLSTTGPIELRRYAPHLVAEVEVAADSVRAAAELGFSPLADYIFGNNTPREQIAMTTPVTAEAAGEQIAMTTPVTSSSRGGGTFVVRFSMPRASTLATMPEPVNERVRVVQIDERLVLARCFRGASDPTRIDTGGDELVAYAAEHDLEVEGSPVWAGYSAPSVPTPLRRWEILLRVRRRPRRSGR